MSKRNGAQAWCCGTILVALLSGCAMDAPTWSDPSGAWAKSRGAMVQADTDRASNQQGSQQMGWNQQQGGQQMGWSQHQPCPAPQQQSTGSQAYGSGGSACGEQQAGALSDGQRVRDDKDKDKKDKDKDKDKDREGSRDAGQQAYGQQPSTGTMQGNMGYSR